MEKHSFPLQEEATEQTPHMDSSRLFNSSLSILAAILSSVKQGKQTICDFTFPLSTSLFAALQVMPARRLQEKSAARCPSLSRLWLAKHHPKHLRVLICKLKRGLFSFTTFAP